jgi:Zn-finger nucleic acid-binding protein
MMCPVDGTELQRAERQGVEIDWCPRCRGVWLDRNELEKIIERTAGWRGSPASHGGYYQEGYEHPYDGKRHRYDGDEHHPHSHKRKREGFLENLFDFG